MNIARIAGIALVSVVALGPASQWSISQAGTGLPWTSDFESGSFSEWNGSTSSSNLHVANTGCYSGRCARADIVSGTTGINYADKWFGDWYTLQGTKVEEVWLRFYSKFSNVSTWPNSGQKLAIINLQNGTDGERRYQVYITVNRSGLYAVDHSDIAAWRFYGLPQNVGTPVTVRPDQWEKIKMYVRLNTPGASDGIVRLWINDELKLQRTDLPIRANTAYGMSKLILSNSAMPEALSNGVQWWDSWTLSQTDPDGGVGAMPTAPTNLRIVAGS